MDQSGNAARVRFHIIRFHVARERSDVDVHRKGVPIPILRINIVGRALYVKEIPTVERVARGMFLSSYRPGRTLECIRPVCPRLNENAYQT